MDKKGMGSILLVLGLKSAKFIKFFKLVKVAKPALVVGSMALSVIAYSPSMGLAFAIGFVLMLLVHEMGHVIAARWKGLPVSAPVFIPFLGAAIFVPEMKDRDTEAFVGLGGPLLGSIGGLATFALFLTLSLPPEYSNFLLLLSFTTSVLNLFNLTPISPLDGGRVLQAVWDGAKYLGLFVIAALTFILRDPGFLIIWILIIWELNIPKQIKNPLAYICYVGMVLLILTGYGASLGSDILDVVLGAVLLLLISFAPERSSTDERPMLSSNLRVLWASTYGALAMVLVYFMVWQYNLMEAMAK